MPLPDNFWADLPKPWTKEQCEQRYTQGEKITLERLAEISGVPAPTLARWSRNAQPPWKDARKDYLAREGQLTRQKTADKVSDRLSDEMSELSIEQLEAYKLCREIATIKGRWLLAKLKRVFGEAQSPHPEVSADDPLAAEFRETTQNSEADKLDVTMLNFLSLTIDRCVRGERMVAGLDYEHINQAIAAVERTGLVVKADDKTLAKLVVSQAREEN